MHCGFCGGEDKEGNGVSLGFVEAEGRISEGLFQLGEGEVLLPYTRNILDQLSVWVVLITEAIGEDFLDL